MDRLSRATLELAARASRTGALVVFEPSSRSDPKLFAEALSVAHVLKYSDQRLNDAGGTMSAETSILLEVQTLGARGLRFRHRLSGAPSEWDELPAIDASNVVDTCGAGDWCTAGLLSRAAGDGREGFEDGGEDALVEALVYGQTLAAKNCEFEGARGAMYEPTERLLADLFRTTDVDGADIELCPACPSSTSA
jgi:fructokinase